MPKISIEYSDEDAAEIAKLLARMKDPVTGEPMTLNTVVETLVEDLALASWRPGSWEGYNIRKVLIGHGWLTPELPSEGAS
jgi:hypothetical protein